jgi:hypothetical protein
MCVCVSLCCIVLCVGRGLGAGLISHPRSPTKCLKGSISKKKIPTPEKGIRKMRKKKKKKKKICVELDHIHPYINFKHGDSAKR